MIFIYAYDIYIQLDGVAMGSPLRSFLANIFMCSLEEAIVLKLRNCLVTWKIYVHDTHAYVNPNKTDYNMLSKANSVYL